MPKTVAFIYGFTEGQWHGTRFRRALVEKGYQVIYEPEKAAIIIAHSGGCYNVPMNLADDQLVVLINPTYWPGRPLALRTFKMCLHILRTIRPGNHPLYQIHKLLHNLGYLLWHAKTNRAMVRRAPKYDLEAEIRHPRTIVVRNMNDPWLTPELEHLKQTNPDLRIVELTGDHDDCWEYPDRYVNLLQSGHD